MPNDREDNVKVRENETELQPDPLMKEGRASSAWVWTIGIAVIAVIVIFFFAVGRNNNHTTSVANQQHATRFTTGASDKPPHTAVPAGRQSSNAPKEGDYHTVR